MINFVIVEDNNHYRKRVVDIIITYMMGNKVEFKISEFDDYNQKLSRCIQDKKYNNIYILDFELPNATAIDIAREIREDDWESPIIILTAYTSLALDSFKQRLQLLDFIGKQIDAEKNLIENLNICLKMFSKEEVYRYTYYNIEHSIPYKSILYLIRDGRRIEIKTIDKSYYQNVSINNIKKLLPKDFLYTTKGVIVNMKRVKEINWKNQTITFDNGLQKGILSKSHKKEIEAYYVD